MLADGWGGTVEMVVVGLLAAGSVFLLQQKCNGRNLFEMLLCCQSGNIWTFMRLFVVCLSSLRFLYETQCSSVVRADVVVWSQQGCAC